MELLKRLAIGTANFGQEYHGTRCKDIDAILDYCQCVGIDMLDTAESYNWDYTKVNDYFKIVTKIKNDEKPRKSVYAILAHRQPLVHDLARICSYKSQNYCQKIGISVYETSQSYWVEMNIIQLPYSLWDRRFESFLPVYKKRGIEIHVRSIFLQGKILQEGKADAKDCIAFALMNPNVDRVIIGVDSLDQLKSNLDYFCKLDLMKKDDPNLIDSRRWVK